MKEGCFVVIINLNMVKGRVGSGWDIFISIKMCKFDLLGVIMNTKRNWKCLDKQKCPVIGCKTKGLKTKLNQTGLGLNLKCPVCGGVWSLRCLAPMDISWVEVEEPNQTKREIENGSTKTFS